jgi:hypothetical protein
VHFFRGSGICGKEESVCRKEEVKYHVCTIIVEGRATAEGKRQMSQFYYHIYGTIVPYNLFLAVKRNRSNSLYDSYCSIAFLHVRWYLKWLQLSNSVNTLAYEYHHQKSITYDLFHPHHDISYQLRKLGKFALSYLDTFIHWRGLHTPRAEPNSVAVGTMTASGTTYGHHSHPQTTNMSTPLGSTGRRPYHRLYGWGGNRPPTLPSLWNYRRH